MMTDLGHAITNRMTGSWQKPAAPFVADPELELQAQRLEQLRADHPDQYAEAGLARLKTQIATYNRRKAQENHHD